MGGYQMAYSKYFNISVCHVLFLFSVRLLEVVGGFTKMYFSFTNYVFLTQLESSKVNTVRCLENSLLSSGVVYEFQCGLCNESLARDLNVRIGEHVDVLPFIKKHVNLKNIPLAGLSLFCNHQASYGDFNIVTCENKKFLLEQKNFLFKSHGEISKLLSVGWDVILQTLS